MKIRKCCSIKKRRIWNFAENEIRIAFDHKKIGDGWVSETILYHLVSEIYPDFQLKRHHRPQILEGLELDIFIPEIKTIVTQVVINKIEVRMKNCDL